VAAGGAKVGESGFFLLLGDPICVCLLAGGSVGSLVYLSLASPGGCTMSAADPGICDMRVLVQNVAERTCLLEVN
jgi:hypothetical protein